MNENTDIDILAYALRKAIFDQYQRAKHREREGSLDAAKGCQERLIRLRRELSRLDALGAIDSAE